MATNINVQGGCREVYGIFTNGGYSGITGGQLKKIITKNSMLFKGYAEFKLASNHITNKSHKVLGDTENCARLCPMNVIEMQNGKPVWTAERCAHCMSCIQNCPTEAIEFGTVTEGRKRYNASKGDLSK